MTCEKIAIDGGVVILCSRGHRIKRCSACGSGEATRLCDFPLSGRKAGKTCSAGLCDRCTARSGDTDLCPAHARLGASEPPKLERTPVKREPSKQQELEL